MNPFKDKRNRPPRAGDTSAPAPTAPADEPPSPPAEELDDPVAAVALTAADLEPPPPEPEAAPPPEPPPPAPQKRAPRVRVLETGTVMLGACRHSFKAGAVIDSNGYLELDFKRLVASLKTEPITE